MHQHMICDISQKVTPTVFTEIVNSQWSNMRAWHQCQCYHSVQAMQRRMAHSISAQTFKLLVVLSVYHVRPHMYAQRNGCDQCIQSG